MNLTSEQDDTLFFDRTKITNLYILEEEFCEKFENQYMNFQDVGYDLIQEYTNLNQDGLSIQITDDIMNGFINYVNENYFQLSDVYYYTSCSKNTQIYGKMIYDLLFVEMANTYLPEMVQKYNLNSPLDFLNYDPMEFRKLFSDYITERFSLLNDVFDLDNLEGLYLQFLHMNFIENDYDDEIFEFYFQPLINVVYGGEDSE